MSRDTDMGCLKVIGAISVVLIVIGLVLILSASGCVYRWTAGVADRVASPDAMITNYEWFEQQMRDVKACEGQIKDAEEAIARFKSDSGPAKDWRFDQREEYARLNANLQGLKSFRRSLIETYNARASMISRNLWKSGSLPQHLDQ